MSNNEAEEVSSYSSTAKSKGLYHYHLRMHPASQQRLVIWSQISPRTWRSATRRKISLSSTILCAYQTMNKSPCSLAHIAADGLVSWYWSMTQIGSLKARTNMSFRTATTSSSSLLCMEAETEMKHRLFVEIDHRECATLSYGVWERLPWWAPPTPRCHGLLIRTMHRLCIAGTLDVGLITESTHTAKTWTRKSSKKLDGKQRAICRAIWSP